MLFEEYKIDSDFRPGDIVNWKHWQDHILENNLIYKYNDLFKISKIEGDKVTLFGVSQDVDMSELSPVPMDGVVDKDIYWDLTIAAPIIERGKPIPILRLNRDYYLDEIDKFYENDISDGQKFSDLAKAHGFRYVHELQHYLTEEYSDTLEINE